MIESKLSRRDMLLIGGGLICLCLGGVADSAFNGTAVSDVQTLNTAAARLSQVPQKIGHWVSTDSELSDREIEAAEIKGYIRREYRNPQTGFSVFLTILCGSAGPMAVHPPTACFQGVGYTLISGPTQTHVTLDNTSSPEMHEFNKSTFKQDDASVPEIVRVFWGWGLGGQWTAPATPRFAYRGQPYLYKIYVVDRWLDASDRQSLPQIEQFLQDALPVIAGALRVEE